MNLYWLEENICMYNSALSKEKIHRSAKIIISLE